jgi:peptidoglycan hydrolase-like protein with peptidoglycan-binding domain
MPDLPKLQGPVRLAVLGGVALVAVAVTAVVMLAREAPSPPPADPPPPMQEPAAAAPPAAARADSNAWPATTEDQIRATQRLLGALKLMDEAPTGVPGPVTRAAIRDYQRMAGLEQTGEVSEALFDSLKEVAALVFPRSAGHPD